MRGLPAVERRSGLEDGPDGVVVANQTADLARADVTLVAPSRWIAGLAAQSPLIGHWPVRVIPNGLDLSVFRPISRAAAREVLGLPQDEDLVLFSPWKRRPIGKAEHSWPRP